jgi:predicted anti-sigma-YlaC factor YlaD
MSRWEHLRFARQLPDLLDADALDLHQAARLQAHVDHCPRCAGRLAQMARAEALLARLPRSLFPLAPAGAGAANGRLATLAQWSKQRPAHSPYGSLSAASALAMAALMIVLSVMAPDWGSVVVGDMSASTTVASVMPDSSFYPLTLR